MYPQVTQFETRERLLRQEPDRRVDELRHG